ncbi:arsenite S-adenosylmethyltransferase [bacterium I07]|nr:arsenite S-adenosylmethyltransferase [bacterium I07]
MLNQTNDEVREAVRETYSKVAKTSSGAGSGCDCGCGPGTPEDVSRTLGYSNEDVTTVPQGSNMGLGCGNPQAIASLKTGETVLDLGSGGGFDCFLAAKAVGNEGHVIGVDMTPDMISKARKNAEKSKFKNVEFRLGEIENLPVADNSVDAIISNCVINLSPEKADVFKDALRVLKPGGRLAITDVVVTAPLPEEIKTDLTLYAGCVSGAVQIEEYESMLKEAGFSDVRIKPVKEGQELIRNYVPDRKIGDYVLSVSIEAVK